MSIVLAILTGGWNWLKIGFGFVGSFLKSLNAQGVVGLLVSLVLAYLLYTQWADARHWRKQDGRDVKALHVLQANDAKLAAQALKIKNDLDLIDQNISSIWKGWNDAQNSRIVGSAQSLRLLGPGKAACNPGIASRSSGYLPSSGTGNAPMASVPQGQGLQLIGLPFADTIDFAEGHDLDRAEVLTWRQWYAALAKSWPKSAPQSQSNPNGANR